MDMENRDTHSTPIGYLYWIFGFTGAHRFYYGKPISGTIYFYTLGLLGVGWLIDLFLIPSMDREADIRFAPGVRLQYCLGIADFLGCSWIASYLLREVAHGSYLALYRRVFHSWVCLRYVDAQPTSQ